MVLCVPQVTNANGVATSAAAILTVAPPPVITTQPVDKTVIVGGSVSLTAAGTGSGTLAYKWYNVLTPTTVASSLQTYTFTAALGTLGCGIVCVCEL